MPLFGSKRCSNGNETSVVSLCLSHYPTEMTSVEAGPNDTTTTTTTDAPTKEEKLSKSDIAMLKHLGGQTTVHNGGSQTVVIVQEHNTK